MRPSLTLLAEVQFSTDLILLFVFGSSIKTKHENDTVTSHLYLATAAAADSGKYTCAVGKLARAKLSLHILNGESVCVFPSLSRISSARPAGIEIVLGLSHFSTSLQVRSRPQFRVVGRGKAAGAAGVSTSISLLPPPPSSKYSLLISRFSPSAG